MSNIYSKKVADYNQIAIESCTTDLETMGDFCKGHGFEKDLTAANLKEFLNASSDKLEDLRAATKKYHADKNPAPKFARILSTYNLKALFTGAAAYGSFVFGLTPIGLVLAGATAFIAAKFAQAHYSAYKSLNVEYSSLYNKDDALTAKIKGSVKNGFFNTVEFLKAVTYGSAAKGMLDSTIAKKDKDSSFYQLGVYSENSEKGFDLKTLGLDAVAALGSALALIYAPISAPLYRLMTAVLPVLVTSPLGNYAMAQTAKARAEQQPTKGNTPLPAAEISPTDAPKDGPKDDVETAPVPPVVPKDDTAPVPPVGDEESKVELDAPTTEGVVDGELVAQDLDAGTDGQTSATVVDGETVTQDLNAGTDGETIVPGSDEHEGDVELGHESDHSRSSSPTPGV